MRKNVMLIPFALVLASVWTLAGAQDTRDPWEVLEDREGVTSWKLAAADGSSVLKGEAEIAASIETVQRVLEDTKHHTEWMHKCIEAVELKRISPSEAILYARTSSPWPVRDRDVVFTFKRSEGPSGEVVFDFVNIRSDLKAEVEGVVRMPKMVGSWRLSKLAPARTKAVYQLETEVGGAVPRWAVRGTLERIPYETLRALRSYVAKIRS